MTIKAIIKRTLRTFGLEVTRAKKPDLSLYDAYPADSIRDKRFYNIGAGQFFHPYWTNIDKASEHYRKAQKAPFIEHDLMACWPLPIEDGVAEIVYSSHVIEHLTDEAVRYLLSEAYRILKPGGVLRLTTPNSALDLRAYLKGDLNWWYWIDKAKAAASQVFLSRFATQLSELSPDYSNGKACSKEVYEAFNLMPEVETMDNFSRRCRYNPDFPGHHINWFDLCKICYMLKDAGFLKFYESAYGQSRCAPLRDWMFDSTHPKISLYVEAVK